MMACVLFAAFNFPLSAQVAVDSGENTDANVKQQIDQLNNKVKAKRANVKEINVMISNYRTRIIQQEAKQASLENQVALLDNQVAETQLDIQRQKEEAEALGLEIQVLEAQISQENARILRQKEDAAEIVRLIHQADEVMPLEVLLTKQSLSAFFDQLEQMKQLQNNLTDALQRVKAIKAKLEDSKKQRDEKLAALEANKKELHKKELALESERNFKTSLIAETQSTQSEFERVLYELKQQQQATVDEISSIETKLKDKLDSVDQALARGDVLLNWPVEPARGISAKFHDPTYPFRNLFQHPGTDVPISVGTKVRAAAGGYVAWNKTGKMYGNYTMIVHPGNVATVYAHLSKFMAKPDTYVDRGDIIGLSGGMPGQPGAGLSTGPHLHFEVRQNGVPVDPENFLPNIASDE